MSSNWLKIYFWHLKENKKFWDRIFRGNVFFHEPHLYMYITKLTVSTGEIPKDVSCLECVSQISLTCSNFPYLLNVSLHPVSRIYHGIQRCSFFKVSINIKKYSLKNLLLQIWLKVKIVKRQLLYSSSWIFKSFVHSLIIFVLLTFIDIIKK